MTAETIASNIFLILATVVGGAITYFVQRDQILASRKSDRATILRTKLEEAYQVALGIREGYAYSWTQSLLRLRGSEPAEPFAKKVERQRLGMLVNLYLPSLVDSFDRVEKAGAEYGKPLARVTMLSSVPLDEREQLGRSLTETYQRLMVELDALLKEACSVSEFR